jgi:hypothetical protein
MKGLLPALLLSLAGCVEPSSNPEFSGTVMLPSGTDLLPRQATFKDGIGVSDRGWNVKVLKSFSANLDRKGGNELVLLIEETEPVLDPNTRAHFSSALLVVDTRAQVVTASIESSMNSCGRIGYVKFVEGAIEIQRLQCQLRGSADSFLIQKFEMRGRHLKKFYESELSWLR